MLLRFINNHKHTKAQRCYHRKRKCECCLAEANPDEEFEDIDEEDGEPYFDLRFLPWFSEKNYGFHNRTEEVTIGPKDNINMGDQPVDAYNLITPHTIFVEKWNSEGIRQPGIVEGDPKITDIVWFYKYQEIAPNNDPNVIAAQAVPNVDLGLTSIRSPNGPYATLSYNPAGESIMLGHTTSTDRNTWQPYDQLITNSATTLINWERIVQDQAEVLLTIYVAAKIEEPMGNIITLNAEMPYHLKWNFPPQQDPQTGSTLNGLIGAKVNFDDATWLTPTTQVALNAQAPNVESQRTFSAFEPSEGITTLTGYDNAPFQASCVWDPIPKLTIEEFLSQTYYGMGEIEPGKQPGLQDWRKKTELQIFSNIDPEAKAAEIALGQTINFTQDSILYDWACVIWKIKGRLQEKFIDGIIFHFFKRQ